MSLFNIEPEYFYDPPSTWDKERKQATAVMIMDDPKYLASEKKDGNYARFVVCEGEARFQSRSISKVTGTYGEFKEKVPHIYEPLAKMFKGDTMIMGELYLPGGNDKNVGSVLRSKTRGAILKQQQKGYLHYWMFDAWYLNGKDLMSTPYEERIKLLKLEFSNNFIYPNEFMHIPQYASGSQVSALYNSVISKGGEGIVLQRRDGLPEPGKRTSWKTLKVKKEMESEASVFIMDLVPPTREYNGANLESWEFWYNIKRDEKTKGKFYESYRKGDGTLEPISKNYYYGWPAGVVCGARKKDGKIVQVCSVSGLNEALKQDLLKDFSKYHYSVIDITGMEVTEDFSIRHPRFVKLRPDLSYLDCSWERIFHTEEIVY